MCWILYVTCTDKSAIKNEIIPNEQLPEQIHKPIISKLENTKYTDLIKTIFGMLIYQICNQ